MKSMVLVSLMAALTVVHSATLFHMLGGGNQQDSSIEVRDAMPMNQRGYRGRQESLLEGRLSRARGMAHREDVGDETVDAQQQQQQADDSISSGNAESSMEAGRMMSHTRGKFVKPHLRMQQREERGENADDQQQADDSFFRGSAEAENTGSGEDDEQQMESQGMMKNEEFFRRRYQKRAKGASMDSDPAEHYGQQYMAPDQHHKNRVNHKGCDCEASENGKTCHITSPAKMGMYCYCAKVSSGTCHGYAYDCPQDKLDTEECQGNCTSDKCCRNVPENWWMKPSCDSKNNNQRRYV